MYSCACGADGCASASLILSNSTNKSSIEGYTSGRGTVRGFACRLRARAGDPSPCTGAKLVEFLAQGVEIAIALRAPQHFPQLTVTPYIEEEKCHCFMRANYIPDDSKNPYDRSCFVIPRAHGTPLVADLSQRLQDVSN